MVVSFFRLFRSPIFLTWLILVAGVGGLCLSFTWGADTMNTCPINADYWEIDCD